MEAKVLTLNWMIMTHPISHPAWRTDGWKYSVILGDINILPANPFFSPYKWPFCYIYIFTYNIYIEEQHNLWSSFPYNFRGDCVSSLNVINCFFENDSTHFNSLQWILYLIHSTCTLWAYMMFQYRGYCATFIPPKHTKRGNEA